MNYRKANINDIYYLVHLRKEQLIEEGISTDANVDKEFFDYFMANISDGTIIIWLATEASEIVATSGICFYQVPPSYSNLTGQVAYVTNVYTSPKYRKQGIASHLLGLVIGEAKKLNYKLIRLITSPAGESIYKKAGFVKSEGHMVMTL